MRGAVTHYAASRRAGAEHCATDDFQWVGLMFPGEAEYHASRRDDLKPA